MERAPSKRQLTAQIGFGHWYGETFGAPIGVSTPALTVGVRPGLSFVELRGYYTVAIQPLVLPTDGEESTVGFAALDVTLTHELRVEGSRMVMGCGPSIGFVHTRQGVGFAFGSDLFARYMLDLSDTLAIGPFMDVRALFYELPESDVPIYEIVDGQLEPGHSDAQIQIGVAVSLL